MGEVYRATDIKLGRDVALKVLPAAFAVDRDRVARFTREAQMLASLNHPNIAAIHHVEDGVSSQGDAISALVMELVDGDTLADRIARGAIPLDQVLPIARQMCDGLEAAHQRGVIHRDFKPSNIKLRGDGVVKILDFGLAKAIEVAPADVSNSPTITNPAMTGVGVLLGTAAYMAPEQARGRSTDKRVDIWAFGCVIYEMLTGHRAFKGVDATDTIAAVMRAEPDWHALPSETPTPVRRLLRRCLAKDPVDRLSEIGDARLEIRDAFADSPLDEDASATRPSSARRTRFVPIGIVAVIAALVIVAFDYLRTPVVETTAYRSTLTAPPGVLMSPASIAPVRRLALSPNGRRLAFVGLASDGRGSIWLRSLDSLAAQPLAGTENGQSPFWSPDSRWIGFYADGKIKKIDVNGGPPLTLCDADGFQGATWNADNVILFGVEGRENAIRRVSAAGGASEAILKPDASKGETEYAWPFFLPDGHHFLVRVRGTMPAIQVASLDSNERKVLLPVGPSAQYSQGYLVFLNGTTLMAQALDVDRLELVGNAMPLAEGVSTTVVAAGVSGAFSVSNTGTLVYQTGSVNVSQLFWFDRGGHQLSSVGEPGDYGDLALSRDARHLAVSILNPAGNRNLWIVDVARGIRTRFTFDSGSDASPVWSADGERLIFDSDRTGNVDLYEKPASGAGPETLLLRDDLFDRATSWSSDGRVLVYNAAKDGDDLWVLPMSGNRKPFAFLQSSFLELRGQLSDDGRWLAYDSNDSGRQEVYVTPFPNGNAKWQVSTTAALLPDGHATVKNFISSRKIID